MGGLVAFGTVDESQQRGGGGGAALGDRREESYRVFSPTLGVYISRALSASDALKDQWRHTVRSDPGVVSTLVNKEVFQINTLYFM